MPAGGPGRSGTCLTAMQKRQAMSDTTSRKGFLVRHTIDVGRRKEPKVVRGGQRCALELELE